MIPANYRGAAKPLTSADIANEAQILNCTEALIHAFSDVESGGLSGFLSTGEPKILFEAHVFHGLTGGQYDDDYPNISSPVWDRSLYGAGGQNQYRRLSLATSIDQTAALESCSWGKYQVMGTNYHLVGYKSVQDMVEAFCDDEFEHLKSFGNFCVGNHLTRYMNPPDFTRLAVGYNGAGEAANGYHQKLEQAYLHYRNTPNTPGSSPVTSHVDHHAPTCVETTDDMRLTLIVSAVAANRAKIEAALAGQTQPEPCPPTGVLRPGDHGDGVLWLQRHLRDWFCPESGVYDDITRIAVIMLEEGEGLLVDRGVAGPQVIGKLRG